ncbi:TonB-dependent receptor [Alteromonas sp. ASW11-36]|uniref:TonB-dependent receptor n=1 Tax=Alteromonas arenosi TaxID=3055817 RepID=A0ABT7SUQ4_9ALTE|nr:TonB-dependent receptor [Alteromonas sp. ASW11-36]MDM7859890.1 TonB-dependent receptor [Alteromonas sp. ASW11-36]
MTSWLSRLLSGINRLWVGGVLFLSPIGLAHAQYAIFDIPSLRADEALILFAKQADITLLFPFDEAETFTTQSLTGEFTHREALELLLKDSTLIVVQDESGKLSVQVAPSDTAELVDGNDDGSNDESAYNSTVEQIAVVGSRSLPRTVTSSPIPIDVINTEQLSQQGETDVLGMLSNLVPSLNVNDQSINDAASLVRPANLRGMASDHTLILVNGKRRHRSAAITFLGGGLSDGAQGPDVSVLPASAIRQVEVLRDGAAAQYGSDAIAGVINFVLKEDSSGGRVSVRGGSFFQGDGEDFQVQANVGVPLGSQGFVNASAEFRQRDATNRAVQRADAQMLRDAGNGFVADPAQYWGTLDVDDDVKFSINAGANINDDLQWYSFSNVARRKIEGGFYFRHPHLRRGVFAAPNGGQGQSQLLVGDLDGLNQGIECPTILINDNNVLDEPGYLLIANNTTAIGQNCFAFNEILPGGFSPRFGGRVEDAAFNMGIKGFFADDWAYDLSVSLGYSGIDYLISNTVNPSLGPDSPTEFAPGGARQIERTISFDITKFMDGIMDEPIHIAAGLEWRKESYHQKAGEESSYQAGFLALEPDSGLSQGFSVGSNGFPGYTPQSAGYWSRSNMAVYFDVETYLNDSYLMGAALRYEHFNDFGATFEGKVTGRYELSDLVSLRSSISTGFKAPTVGQSNVINVTTAFSERGLEDQATLPPTNPISIQVGATPLRPEESVNKSLGLVYYWHDGLFVTLDYFHITLKDRISTTSAIQLSQDDIRSLTRVGVPLSEIFESVKFFTNDFDTTTQGIDVVINYEFTSGRVQNSFSGSLNWTQTEVDRVTLYPRINALGGLEPVSNLTPARIHMLEDNLPDFRAVFALNQSFNDFDFLWRLRYFSGFYEDHLDASAGLDIEASAETVFDVELSYRFNENWRMTIGAQNFFDNRPSENPFSDLAGARYPPTSPLGMNGGYYYAQMSYSFN